MIIRPSHKRHFSLRIGKARQLTLYALIALLLITGAIWLLVHMTRAEDAMPNALEPWLMKVHGAASMLIIFVSGTLLYGHMLNAWHQDRNRLAGGVIAISFLLIGSTGYGLYYFDGDVLRRITEWLHWIVGFGLPVLLWWHVVSGSTPNLAEKSLND
jgi:hypothetical protein